MPRRPERPSDSEYYERNRVELFSQGDLFRDVPLAYPLPASELVVDEESGGDRGGVGNLVAPIGNGPSVADNADLRLEALTTSFLERHGDDRDAPDSLLAEVDLGAVDPARDLEGIVAGLESAEEVLGYAGLSVATILGLRILVSSGANPARGERDSGRALA